MAAAQGRDLIGPPAAERGTRVERWLTPPRRRVVRRSIKVALAATVATFIAQAMGLPVPWFATISAVVAVEATLRVSLRTAGNAVLGAVVGAAVGLALATVAKDQVWAVGVVVLVSFAVFGLARMDQVARQSALVASVIVLVPTSSDLTTPEFAGVRLLETLIGIVVALVVNATVLPPRAFRGARRHLGESYLALARMYRSVVATAATGRADPDEVLAARRAFRVSIRQVDELWDEALSEHPEPYELAPHWHATTRRIWEQCAALADAVMNPAARSELEGASDELRALAEATAGVLDRISETLTTSDVDPLPRFPELEQLRSALLERVRAMEVHDGELSFADALQALAFVNSMVMIATRLDDLVPDAPPGSRDDLHLPPGVAE